MPKKKVSKKGKKGKKKSAKKEEETPAPRDPMAPSYVPPPFKPGEQVRRH